MKRGLGKSSSSVGVGGGGREKRLCVARTVILEKTMGISQYIEWGQNISAIIKHRYQDFHVHEVHNGTIVHLKNLEYKEQDTDNVDNNNEGGTEKVEVLSVLDKCKELGDGLGDDEFPSRLQEIVEKQRGSVSTRPITDKPTRTLFHRNVKRLFGSMLDTKTVGEEIVVTVMGKGVKKQRRGKSWKQMGGEYCHFTMYKENRDTMDSIQVLARLLK
jgi:tRNA pseudouridine13 synthase